MAALEGANEVMCLQGLVNELGIEQETVQLNCESEGALHLSKNNVHHARTKHIDLKYDRLWELIEDCDMYLQKIHYRGQYS